MSLPDSPRRRRLIDATGFRALLLVALLGAGSGPSAQAQSADEPAASERVVEPATQALPDAAAAESRETPAQASGRLAQEIEDLRGLLAGQLPRHVTLPALFEIDLSDEDAVSQRVTVLRERLGSAVPAVTDPSAPATTTPAVPEPGAEASVAATVADPLDLRRERDRLRLAFLTLPVERRHALREQDRARRDAEALSVEQQASAAALAASEEARDRALAEARRAADDRARWLATEEARLLAHRSELAALRQSWAQHNQTQLDARRALLERYAAVDAGTSLAPQDADALYATIRDDLRGLRREAGRALSALNAPSVVFPLDDGSAPPVLDAGAEASARARLAPLRKAIADEESGLREREADERYADAANVMGALATLQARRIALLPWLSPSLRREVTGPTRAGMQRVASEIAHLRLMAQWYPVQRLHTAHDFTRQLHNLFEAGRFGAGVLSALLALVGVLVLRRRSVRWLGRLRAWLSLRVQPRSLMLRIDGLMRMLVATAPELTQLAAIYVLFDMLLAGRVRLPELGTLRELSYAYAYYALALAFIHRVLLTAVSRYGAVSGALNLKILASLRLVARLVLIVSIYLILAQALLGRGALYGIARNMALLGAFLVAWRLIRNWREEVTTAYLRQFPRGSLAERVRASQGRSHGLMIASAAFVFVAARGVWIWLRDLALGFEQTRKALAYLFRRQLERQSKHQPAPTDPRLLPAPLQAALTEDPAPQHLCIDHYPQLDRIVELARGLAQGRRGALVALTGERGTGKTTWMQALQRGVGADLICRTHSFDARCTDPAQVCRALSRLLEVDETDDPDTLIAQLAPAPAQLVMLDLCHNLMLRTVGGLAGYEVLVRVAEATAGRVLWVAAFARWPFEYLQRMHPGRDVFDHTITLRGWSETHIGEMIERRLESAGFTADYDQLLLNVPGLASRVAPGPAQLESAERNADRYHRLIWDYADGNPRIALHFFRLSLAWTAGTKVTVRLFPRPEVDPLEEFKPRTHFVLSCLVQHENLTPDEAAASLRFSRAECARALEMLHQNEFLACENGERYRVTSHWNRAVLRFLQRKKMLVV